MRRNIWVIITLLIFLTLALDLSLSIANASLAGIWFSGIAFLLCIRMLPKGRTGFAILFSIINGLVLGTNLGAIALSYFVLRLVSPMVNNLFLSLVVESLGFFSLFALLSSMLLPINFVLVNAVLAFIGMIWMMGQEKITNYSGYSL